MPNFFFLPLILLSFLFSSPQASAQTSEPYAIWIQNMTAKAIARGVNAEVARTALNAASLDPRVIALDQRQPEKSISFATYAKRILTPQKIKKGRALLTRHTSLLQKISADYGVPAGIIVALWGIETGYGHNQGSFSLIDSLVSLAYEGRRADFFENELLIALQILDSEKLTATELQSSWAGAMGQCQFMPSTYSKYAVDYNGDGMRDIWNDSGDVFASIANYLVAEGWRRNLTWGREVILSRPIPADLIGLKHQENLASWSRLGVKTKDKKQLPTKEIQASLIQPDGLQGRSFLVYDNFRALMRWNRSTYFATTVGLLADQLNASHRL